MVGWYAVSLGRLSIPHVIAAWLQSEERKSERRGSEGDGGMWWKEMKNAFHFLPWHSRVFPLPPFPCPSCHLSSLYHFTVPSWVFHSDRNSRNDWMEWLSLPSPPSFPFLSLCLVLSLLLHRQSGDGKEEGKKRDKGEGMAISSTISSNLPSSRFSSIGERWEEWNDEMRLSAFLFSRTHPSLHLFSLCPFFPCQLRDYERHGRIGRDKEYEIDGWVGESLRHLTSHL